MAKEQTTSYRWDDQGIIRRIDVRQQKNGFAVAYLYADPAEERRSERQNIRAAIRLKGWGTLSDSRDGQFVLRVTGLRNGDDLIDLLRQQGFMHHVPKSANVSEEEEQSKGVLQDMRSNSLRWSGIFATAGNALSMSSGVHRSRVAGKTDWGQIGKGFFFSLADLPLMIAGGRDDSRQLGTLLTQLKKHYNKEGIEIPSTASIHVETSDKGKTLGERGMDFLHRYANQIKCSFEVAAAGMSIWAGKTQRSKFKQYSPYFWGSGFLASMLIPERKIDPEKYIQAGAAEKLWMNIQSNPLSIAGVLGYTNNIGDYLSSHHEKKEWLANGKNGPPLYLWDRVTPTVMLGANGLYAISKKTVGGDIKSDAMVQDAYRIACQIINKQPEELRGAAIESTARFFAQRTEIKEHYPEVKERLIKELDSQRENPWFEKQGLGSYVPQPKKHTTGRREEAEAVVAEALPAAAVPPTVVNTKDIAHEAQIESLSQLAQAH